LRSRRTQLTAHPSAPICPHERDIANSLMLR
jgi:hypothetical protein